MRSVLGLRTRNLHLITLLLGPMHIENFAVHRTCTKDNPMEIPRTLRELGMT
jgi:hypothetical protein